MRRIRIGARTLGEGEPVYVIAEAGSNHDGKLSQARALIDAAQDAGADAVKFQTFQAETMYPKSSAGVAYLRKLGIETGIYDLIREIAMPLEWIPDLARYCEEIGIDFLSTPFDEHCADLLEPHVPAFKIASYELTHLPLIRHVARKGKPLLLSTGAGQLAEVAEAVDAAREEGNDDVCVLQCTARYPAELDTINVRVLDTLRERFDLPVGLSDHSVHPTYAPAAAVARGARVIEKHFTLSRRLPGPDHSFALEPGELRAMVEAVRATELVLGTAEKRLQPTEAELVNYRRAIYTARPVRAGAPLEREDLIVLRRPGSPEVGLHPGRLGSLVGQRAARDLPAQALLTADDVR